MDESGAPLSGAQVFMQIRNAAGTVITSLQGFSDTEGCAVLKWKTSKSQTTGTYTATVGNVIKNAYEFDAGTSITDTSFFIQ